MDCGGRFVPPEKIRILQERLGLILMDVLDHPDFGVFAHVAPVESAQFGGRSSNTGISRAWETSSGLWGVQQ